MKLNIIQTIAISIFPFLSAITFHELAHAYMANLLGDKTAKLFDRLSFNPIKHIDTIGTIIFPLILLVTNSGIIFGWAKPIPINYNNLKNPNKDLALISIAGPISNLIMAILWGIIAKIFLILINKGFDQIIPLYLMGITGIIINISLMILNLLPLPMFDGEHIYINMFCKNNNNNRKTIISLFKEWTNSWIGTMLLIFIFYLLTNIIISYLISLAFLTIKAIFGLSHL